MTLAVLGAGFIGMNFIRHAVAKGESLSVLDHNPCPATLEGKVRWHTGDLSDEKRVSDVIDGADTVFHFISSTVPGDEINIACELQQNVFQMLQLLNLCIRRRIRRVVFASSSSVYGVQRKLPIPEDAPTNPISSHGIHKLAIEKYLQLHNYTHGLDCKILRLSNPYGPGQKLHGRQGFIAIAIGRIIDGQEIVIRGDGSIIRDFIFIEDVCDTLLASASTTSSDILFNVGSGEGHSLNQVIETLERILGRTLTVRYVENRHIDIPESVLDISHAKTILNLRPNTTLEDGLRETLNHHGVI